jgi:hypothetical protein
MLGTFLKGATAAGGIKYVGGYTLDVGNANPVTFTFDGNLSGGLSSSPQQGDIVFIAVGASGGSPVTWTNSSGFTLLNNYYADNIGSNADTSFGIFYKIMGATPDTSITISGSGFKVIQAYVLRNVDDTTPLDVTPTSALTTTNGSTANPPSITPTTSGAAVIAIAGVSGAGSLTPLTAPTAEDFEEGGSGFFRIGSGVFLYNWSSGAVDPPAYGGGGSNSRASAAVTIALRPA